MMIDERTELLINRKLDGQLSPADALELDRRLIRDPQARTLLEDYARDDGLAGEAIASLTAERTSSAAPTEVAAWSPSRKQRWLSLGMISGIAAALALAVLTARGPLGQDASPDSGGMNSPAMADAMADAMPNAASHAASHAMSGDPTTPDVPAAQPRPLQHVAGFEGFQGPIRQTDRLDRDVIGIWDAKSRSLYLLEADVARSALEPVKYNY